MAGLNRFGAWPMVARGTIVEACIWQLSYLNETSTLYSYINLGRPGASLGSFDVSFLFPTKQRLSPLGYCAPLGMSETYFRSGATKWLIKFNLTPFDRGFISRRGKSNKCFFFQFLKHAWMKKQFNFIFVQLNLMSESFSRKNRRLCLVENFW